MREKDQLVLDAIAGRRPNGNNKVRANCPFCEAVVGKIDRKQCLELSTDSGWWKCYRCDSRGKLDEVPYDTTTLKPREASEDRPPVSLPEGFVPLWTAEGQALALTPARKYLKTRVGFTPRVIAGARVGACYKQFTRDAEGRGRRNPFHERIIVPIYKGGKLAGYVGRTWNKNVELKYRYSEGFDRANTLYNEEALYVTTTYPAILVEGTFDTFPFWRETEQLSDGVAALGKLSHPQFEMLLNARRPILIANDGDAWREGEALAMQLQQYKKTARSLRLPPKKDPDELADWVIEHALELQAEVERGD